MLVRATHLALLNSIHALADTTLTTHMRDDLPRGRSLTGVQRRRWPSVVQRIQPVVDVLYFASFFSHFSEIGPKLGILVLGSIALEIS